AINNYTSLLRFIESVLIERRTTLLPKQANVFTTNYDLLLERASENVSVLRLNDGFVRTPGFTKPAAFAPQSFFETVSNSGRLYDYRVELPSLNYIKLHGSVSWKASGDSLLSHITSDTDPRDETP